MSNGQVYDIAFRLGASVDSNMRSAFSNASNQVNNLNTQTTRSEKAMKLFKVGAMATTGALVGLTAGLGAAVKSAGEFSGAMKQIEAATGASKADMKEIKDISTNLYNSNLGEDWNDLADAISQAKSVTALSGEELEKATAHAIVYRDVWGEEVSQSVKAADTMMRNFGITSEQSYNLLAQGAQKGLNKSDELIDSANEYAPYFSKLGFSGNQMFDVFSAGLENGAFNLDKVGDAVKEFGIRSKDGSKASMEAYQMIGLNGEKMTKTFAEGGPAAQKAFNQVVDALGKMKDPVAQNAAAVGLFGTMAEDLEIDVITSLGGVRSQFDMTKNTMEQVKNIKYDTLGMAFQGIGRQIETGFLIPIGEKLLPIVTDFSKYIAKHMPTIQSVIGSSASKIGGFFSSIGDNVKNIMSNIPIADILKGFKQLLPTIESVSSDIGNVFQTAWSIASPILSKIGDFAVDIFGQISQFWSENGAQILQAVQNVFSGINKIIQFLAPVVLFILNMVWTNVKGVIQGALNIIMGLVKIFSGLFTGDFKKMWEGVKQIFFGAIQFVWNAINLLFYGKILGGIKALATGAIKSVSGMWTSIKQFFSGGASAVWTRIVELIPKITSGFSKMKDKAVGFAKDMWTKVTEFFGKIVTGAKELPGKIGEGIKAMAGYADEGIKSLGNQMLKGIGKVVNGVIDGLKWVTGKIGVEVSLSNWEVPQYAQGTSGHPGGLAILGDGGGPELFRTPSGFTGMSPGTDTLMNLPKGTEVLTAKETKAIMSQIPAYKNGKKGNFFSGLISSGKETASNLWNKGKDAFSSVKDIALDVFSYIDNPSKLFNMVLEKFGVSLPPIGGKMGEIASGAFTFLKDKAVSFLKDKLKDFGGFSGGTAAPSQVSKWLTAAINITGVPMSWLGPLQTMAMKESGGNPRAINLWDINAKRGIPSKGLLQTIDPTFNAYKLPGMNDIWNPIHNAVAAIRYTQSRYGSVFNTPGIRNMGRGGGYKGYYKGGNVPNTQWAWVGEQGPELMKVPGGSKVIDNKKSNKLLASLLSFGSDKRENNSISKQNNNDSSQFVYAPEIHIGDRADKADIESYIQSLLSDGYEEFKEMIKRYEREKQSLLFE